MVWVKGPKDVPTTVPKGAGRGSGGGGKVRPFFYHGDDKSAGGREIDTAILIAAVSTIFFMVTYFLFARKARSMTKFVDREFSWGVEDEAEGAEMDLEEGKGKQHNLPVQLVFRLCKILGQQKPVLLDVFCGLFLKVVILAALRNDWPEGVEIVSTVATLVALRALGAALSWQELFGLDADAKRSRDGEAQSDPNWLTKLPGRLGFKSQRCLWVVLGVTCVPHAISLGVLVPGGAPAGYLAPLILLSWGFWAGVLVYMARWVPTRNEAKGVLGGTEDLEDWVFALGELRYYLAIRALLFAGVLCNGVFLLMRVDDKAGRSSFESLFGVTVIMSAVAMLEVWSTVRYSLEWAVVTPKMWLECSCR